MSFSGLSPSRNNSCAMMLLATISVTALPKMTIRSLSKRLKISQARSPRCVCSITLGKNVISSSSSESHCSNHDPTVLVISKSRRDCNSSAVPISFSSKAVIMAIPHRYTLPTRLAPLFQQRFLRQSSTSRQPHRRPT